MTFGRYIALRGAKAQVTFLLVMATALAALPGAANAQSRHRATTRRSAGNSSEQRVLAALTVTAPNINTTTGANFSIPITCGDTTGLNIISFQFDLNYDPSVITPQVNPISTTGTISDGMLPTFNPISPGLLKVVFFTTAPRVGAGILFYFKFTAVGPIGSSSPLNWINFKWDEGSPAAIANPGQVNIVGPTAAGALVNGRLLTALGQPVGMTRVTLTDAHGAGRTAISSPLGYFSFTDVATGQSYVVSVDNRRFHFADQLITVNGDIAELTLTAEP